MSDADVGPRLDAPASVRLCDAAVLAFAAWTLACHAVVLAGGSLRQLVCVAAAAALAAGVAHRWQRRRRNLVAAPSARVADECATLGAIDAEVGRSAALRLAAALAGAALVCVAAAVSSSVVAPWGAAVLVLLLALGWEIRRGSGPWLPARRTRRLESSLWLLAVLGAALPLLVQHPNADDAFYVNLAVGAADAPDAPLLRYDTMYGIAGLPLMLSIYKVHSLELLAAALAWISPLTGIQACHLILPAFFGLLAPLAIARLARLAAPKEWIWVVVGVVAILLLVGGPMRWYANFGFVLLHQGKGVFVTVMVPLLLAYALEFARRPGARTWIRLLAVQVAAVGVSATAIWAGPAIAGLGLVAGCLAARRGVATLVRGALASAYVLALGVALRSEAVQALDTWTKSLELTGRVRSTPPNPADPAFLAGNWTDVMGAGAVSCVCLFAICAAWGFCNHSQGRRLALVLPLGFLLLFDPFAAPFLAETITGNITYFRVFWVLPVPFLLALVLASPLEWRWLPVPRNVRSGAVAVAAGLLLTLVPARAVLAPENDVHFAVFGLDVPPVAYGAAARLVASVPPRSRVLAPKEVSVWVGTFHDHPYAVVPRNIYLQSLAQHLDEDEVRRRWHLANAFYRERLPLESPQAQQLLDALERYDLKGVCIPTDAEGTRSILEHAGLVRAFGDADYEIWVRS